MSPDILSGTSTGVLNADDDEVLVLRKVAVSYTLALPDEHRGGAQEVHATHAGRCPNARSVFPSDRDRDRPRDRQSGRLLPDQLTEDLLTGSSRARSTRPWVDHRADGFRGAVAGIDAASPFGDSGQLSAKALEPGEASLDVPQALIDKRERLCARGLTVVTHLQDLRELPEGQADRCPAVMNWSRCIASGG